MTHTTSLYGSRTYAHKLVDNAPSGSVMTIKPPRRSNDQNALLWALLSRISAAKPDGRAMTPEVWKALFMHALDHSQRFEMALDGNGMVPVGFRSSRLTVRQMSDLLEVVMEYAARHGVDLGEVA